MEQILKAEHLKMKRTVGKRLIVIAPAVTILLSMLAGTYFYSCAYNFWYAFFYSSITAIICIQVNAKEDKKLAYKNIYMTPLELRRMWRGKILIAACYAFASCMVLSLLTAFLTAGMGIQTKTGIISLVLSGIVIFLTCSYQIPVYFYLSKRFHFMLPLLLSILFSMLGIGFSNKNYWWAIPFSWCDRLMCSVLHILPNGLFIDTASEYLLVSGGSIVVICIVSLALFAAEMRLTEILFSEKAGV